MLSPAVEELVTQLARLPGIGRRTAQRLAFHILSERPEDALELARAIEDVKARVRFCRECGNLTEAELCDVCSDARRDRSVICVVEQPVDVVSVERTGEYTGLYHVLGGALSPLDGVEPADLRIDGLIGRVEANGVQRGRARDESDDDGRGHCRLHRRPLARPRSGHPTRQRSSRWVSARSPFTSGTTKGIPSCRRDADDLSMQIAPASAVGGTNSRFALVPTEKRH